MIDIDPIQLAAALPLIEPWHLRTVAFEVHTFDCLKDIQRTLEGLLRRKTSNAEVLKYLIHTHPGVTAMLGDEC